MKMSKLNVNSDNSDNVNILIVIVDREQNYNVPSSRRLTIVTIVIIYHDQCTMSMRINAS